MIIQDLGKSIEEYKAKLVIVDSIIALHRAEFTGRETLADRQQKLNIMLHKLNRLAEVAVVITNQVLSQPDDSPINLVILGYLGETFSDTSRIEVLYIWARTVS